MSTSTTATPSLFQRRSFSSRSPAPKRRDSREQRAAPQSPNTKSSSSSTSGPGNSSSGVPKRALDDPELRRWAYKRALHHLFRLVVIFSGTGALGLLAFMIYKGHTPALLKVIVGDRPSPQPPYPGAKPNEEPHESEAPVQQATPPSSASAAPSQKAPATTEQVLSHKAAPAPPTKPTPSLVPEALELVETIDTLYAVAASERSADQKSSPTITTTATATTQGRLTDVIPTETPAPNELGVDNEADVFTLRQNVESFILSRLAQSMSEWKEKKLQEMFAEQAKARERLEDQLFISTNAEYPDYEAAIHRIAELEAQLILQAEMNRGSTQTAVESAQQECFDMAKSLLQSTRNDETRVLAEAMNQQVVEAANVLTQQRVQIVEQALAQKYEEEQQLIADTLQASVREMYATKQEELLRQFSEHHAEREKLLHDVEARINAFEYILQDYAEYERRSRQLQRMATSLLDLDAAVDSGQGFAEQWRQLSLASKSDPVVELAIQAVDKEIVRGGTPTLPQLHREFNRLEKLGRTQAYLPTYPTVWGHLMAKIFGTLTLSEHALRPDEDEQSIISRAGFYLFECQDVRAAVQELDKLSERTRAIFSEFIHLCRGRLAVEQSMDAIRAEVRVQEAQLQ